jgi:2-keto-4-pentenoate hydratase
MNPIEAAVSSLLQARRDGVTVPAPGLPDAAAAYAVQAAVAESLDWFGGKPAQHWKSGGPSREAVLTHAPLPPERVAVSPADMRAVPFHWRGIEAEIALRLHTRVDATLAATLDRAAAKRLVEALCVSIEIVDSRWREGPDAPALAKLADLQSHGALVLGEWLPFEARDWAAQSGSVRIGEQPVFGFRGSHAMDDPAFVLPAWLRHATRGGAVVEAHSVVTTGTWCGLLQARAGDAVEVQFDGIGQARVQL